VWRQSGHLLSERRRHAARADWLLEIQWMMVRPFDAMVLVGRQGWTASHRCSRARGGIGEPLLGRLLVVDVLTMQFSTLRIAADPDCGCRHAVTRQRWHEGRERGLRAM
jgi:hypothetical protein